MKFSKLLLPVLVAVSLSGCATSPGVVQTNAQNAVANVAAVSTASVAIVTDVVNAVVAIVAGPIDTALSTATKVQSAIAGL